MAAVSTKITYIYCEMPFVLDSIMFSLHAVNTHENVFEI
jgi:hypothetical protein